MLSRFSPGIACVRVSFLLKAEEYPTDVCLFTVHFCWRTGSKEVRAEVRLATKRARAASVRA